MKHVVSSGNGWDLSGYFDYLAKNRAVIPVEVFTFAADVRNYDLVSHQSLHDAWLEWFLISEVASGERSEMRSVQIECRFLGPFHDQYVELKYLDVSGYTLKAASPTLANSPVGHGDLLMHEVRMDGDRVIHEMVFSGGAELEIICGTFSHRLVLRSAP